MRAQVATFAGWPMPSQFGRPKPTKITHCYICTCTHNNPKRYWLCCIIHVFLIIITIIHFPRMRAEIISLWKTKLRGSSISIIWPTNLCRRKLCLNHNVHRMLRDSLLYKFCLFKGGKSRGWTRDRSLQSVSSTRTNLNKGHVNHNLGKEESQWNSINNEQSSIS
jgi:hypothetical protein